MTIETIPLHFAANGRLITACGLVLKDRNCSGRYFDKGVWHEDNSAFQGEDHRAKCKLCQAVLAAAEDHDAHALAITSQDNSPDAEQKAREAGMKARLLAARLGPGWGIRVWHNCLWYWKAVSPGGSVTVEKNNHNHEYTAHSRSDQYGILATAYNKDPAKAVHEVTKKTMEQATAEIEKQTRVFLAMKDLQSRI